MQRVRKALDYASKHLDLEHLLANQRLLTDGKELFWEFQERSRDGKAALVNLSRGGQKAFPEAVMRYLREMEWGKDSFATRWWPGSEPRAGAVVIDPRRAFGAPVLAGNRHPDGGRVLTVIRRRASRGTRRRLRTEFWPDRSGRPARGSAPRARANRSLSSSATGASAAGKSLIAGPVRSPVRLEHRPEERGHHLRVAPLREREVVPVDDVRHARPRVEQHLRRGREAG